MCNITRGDSPQNSCRFFISFLSRERKETKQRKETAARLKFSCVPGYSDAQPFQCLRRRGRGTLFSQTVLPTQGCETHLSPPPPAAPSGLVNGKFQTGGPPCGKYCFVMKVQIGNSGLKIIEGRHQPGPRYGARTFVPEVIDEHRVRHFIVMLASIRLPLSVHRLPLVISHDE